MDVPQVVVFNGVEYRLMGTGKYYLSQSRSNEGRRHAKGLHVAIWEFYSGKTVPPGYEVHHKDGNTFNNDYSNLECIPRAEHRAMYKATDKVRAHLDEIRPLASEWHRSEEGKEWHREHGRKTMEKRERHDCVCEQCGKVFQTMHLNTRFCSHNCSVKWEYTNKKTTVHCVCEWCGKAFDAEVPPRESAPRTCSRSCRSKLRAKEQGQRVDYGEVLRKTCPICGKEFETKRRYAAPEGSECCCQSHAVQWGKWKKKQQQQSPSL